MHNAQLKTIIDHNIPTSYYRQRNQQLQARCVAWGRWQSSMFCTETEQGYNVLTCNSSQMQLFKYIYIFNSIEFLKFLISESTKNLDCANFRNINTATHTEPETHPQNWVETLSIGSPNLHCI